MNGTAQREHRRRTDELADQLEALASAMDGALEKAVADVRELVGSERTHRLQLADEQRAYVDRADKAIVATHEAFYRLGFIARLRWLLRGAQ